MLEFRQDRDIDPRAGVALTGCLPTTRDAAQWKETVEALVDLHQRFVAAGGLGDSLESSADPTTPPQLAWNPDGFTCYWARHSYRPMDLVVLLRMLDHVRVQHEQLASIELRGLQIAAADTGTALPMLEEWLGKPVQFRRRLHVEIEFEPKGSWVDLECRIDPPFDHQVVAEIDARVLLWRDMANAGGFQTDLATPEPVEHFGVALGEATEGDDFLSWSMQTLDIPQDGLSPLINLLDTYAAMQGRLTHIYVG